MSVRAFCCIWGFLFIQPAYDANHKAFMTFGEIDSSGKKTIMGKYTVSAEDYDKLTTLAKQSYSAVAEVKKLK